MDNNDIYTIAEDGSIEIHNVAKFMQLFDICLYDSFNTYFEKCYVVASAAGIAAENAKTPADYRNIGKYKKMLKHMADKYYKLKWDCLTEINEKIEDPDFYDAAEGLFIGNDILLNELTKVYGISWD